MAQDLVAARYDIGQLQLALRWESATIALGYVRELAARDNAAAGYLRKRRGRRGQGSSINILINKDMALQLNR